MRKRTNRPELIRNICNMINLPIGKKTYSYFTRKQLVELKLFLDKIIKKEITNEIEQGN